MDHAAVSARHPAARGGRGDAPGRRRRGRGRDLTAELSPTLAAARGNPDKLRRVLFNLIQNAIHHTPPDGSVTARAVGIGDAIEIEVADTGTGIAGEHRTRMFEPFYRAEGARTTEGRARLAVSRAIVEAHGGSIWLEDATAGTRVRFRLPASSPAPARV